MSNSPRAPTTPSVAGFPPGTAGITPPTNPEGTGGFLSDVIVELGFVDRETVERALEAAREPGRRVDLILLETGALTDEELSRATAERYGLDHVDLDQFEVDMGAASLISRSTALRYRAVPIATAADGALIVAVADPVDALGISDVEVMTKSEIRKAVARGSAIDALAERLPEVGARQPAANSQAAGTMSPPPPTSQPSPTPPASEAPGDPRPAIEPTGIYAERALDDHPLERELRDRERPQAKAMSAALEAELAEAHDALREQVGQAETERSRLQEQIIEVAQERDRLREAVEQVTQERDTLRGEGSRTRPELDLLRAQVRELEDADRRAEAARLVLTELREESEREREQSTRLERKLRDELAVAEERGASLELRLSGLTAAAAKAKAIAQELLALHGMIIGHDLGSDGDRAPQATLTEPHVQASPVRGGATKP